MLKLMAHTILRSITARILENRWFSIIVDETTDVSVKEQVSISLRYVEKNFEIQEDVLGFYETGKTDAASLVAIVEDVLLRLNLDIGNCRGQCYDGAANMAGRFSGVQARIRAKCEKALYVHCCAHSLNLAVQDAVRKIPIIRDTLDYVRELNTVIRGSAKRFALFENIRTEPDDDEEQLSSKSNISLRQLCPTRWTVKADAMKSVLTNYVAAIETLEQIAEEDRGESGSKSSGLVKILNGFQFFLDSNLVFRFLSFVMNYHANCNLKH